MPRARRSRYNTFRIQAAATAASVASRARSQTGIPPAIYQRRGRCPAARRPPDPGPARFSRISGGGSAQQGVPFPAAANRIGIGGIVSSPRSKRPHTAGGDRFDLSGREGPGVDCGRKSFDRQLPRKYLFHPGETAASIRPGSAGRRVRVSGAPMLAAAVSSRAETSKAVAGPGAPWARAATPGKRKSGESACPEPQQRTAVPRHPPPLIGGGVVRCARDRRFRNVRRGRVPDPRAGRCRPGIPRPPPCA